MKAFENYEIWWVTGAQLLYGGDAVIAVDAHSKEMVAGLNEGGNIPIKVVYKGTANSSKEVEQVMKAANNDEKCVGIITWMHTFSPAKMWIKGLQALQKPLLHFHTQYNAEIPWDTIDMDFMNLNQSAHGDIEFGHICTRMRIPRKVVCGYWKSQEAQEKIAVWARVAAGVADAKNVRCLMFGMNMNNVAVTDGDRVEFEQRMGYHVDYYPVSSLVEYLKKVTDAEADALVEEYKRLYEIKIDESGEEVYWEKVKNAAKAEIALRRVLADEGATAFTTNFDDWAAPTLTTPTSLASTRFRVWPHSVSWPKVSASVPRAIGRQPACAAPSGLSSKACPRDAHSLRTTPSTLQATVLLASRATCSRFVRSSPRKRSLSWKFISWASASANSRQPVSYLPQRLAAASRLQS